MKTYYILPLLLLVLLTIPVQAQDITSGIVSCWDLEEGSGTRLDSVDANHLTDVNTVPSDIGKINDSADFVSINQEMLFVNSTDFQLSNNDFTLTGWAKFDSISQVHTIFSKGEFTAISVREMYLYYEPGNGLVFALASDGFNFDGVIFSGVIPTPGVWYFVAIRHDTSINQMSLRINNNPDLTSVYNAGPPTASNSFRIGSSFGTFFYMNGNIDSVMFWDRSLSDSEIDEVYNGGNGIGCESVSGVPPINGDGATQIEIDLPSGGTGILSYEMTAGEALIILSLSILTMLIFYQMLQGLGRGAKIR